MYSFHKILKQDLILQIMNYKDHYLEKKLKSCWINVILNRWKNNDRVYRMETKNMKVFNI